MNTKNHEETKKSNRRNYISRNKSTKASSSVAAANIVIKTKSATHNLRNLKVAYQQKEDYSDTRGFIADLRYCLGIPNTKMEIRICLSLMAL